MKIVFTFDDGRSDSYNASNVLNKNNLKGTFFITTGFIDETYKTNAFGINRKPLNIDELKMMSFQGHEIASHGDKHIAEKNDFYISYNKLIKWGLVSMGEKIGFSIPNSNYNNDSINNFKNDCLAYIRAGRNFRCYTLWSKIMYVFYHMTKFQFFYNEFNKYNLNNLQSDFLYSIVVTKDIKPINIINFITKYSNTDKIVVLMFHSIVDQPSNKWEYSLQNFEFICERISFLVNDKKIINSVLINAVEKK